MKVLITGGELFNKGAQSMTLSVVSEIRNRYPHAQISLLSAPDCRRKEGEKSQYRFSILPWDMRMKLRKLPLFGVLFKNKYFSAEQETQMWEQISEADLVVDVSGFCLSSQFSKMKALDYLSNIYIFKRIGIPVVLFPQSFGPFDFKGVGAGFIKKQITRLLQYPVMVFAREQDGLEQLKGVDVSQNVHRSLDTVLLTRQLSFDNIFNTQPGKSTIQIKPGSVAIVPNQKVFVKNQGNALINSYQTMINHLLQNGKNVYLLRHSFEDKDIVLQLKSLFAEEARVVALEQDFSALELTSIIGQFDFIIASRYHAVVHAYKCCVPAVVLGWAIKYQSLTEAFDQLKYCFDVRTRFDDDKIIVAINHMLTHHKDESKKLGDMLQTLDKDKLFDKALGFAKQS